MNKVQKLLGTKQSKERAQEVARLALNSDDTLAELMDCFFSDNIRLCQVASWPLQFIHEKNPERLSPFFRKMTKNLENSDNHDAVIRNTLRIFQFIEIPVELEGMLFEKCCTYLLNPSRAIAIRAFSISVATKVAVKYPELKDEMSSIFEEISEYPQTPAMRVRIKNAKEVLNLE